MVVDISPSTVSDDRGVDLGDSFATRS